MTTIDPEQLTKFIKDPIIVRIIHILDITSLSILELQEYDLTRKDINHALSNYKGKETIECQYSKLEEQR